MLSRTMRRGEDARGAELAHARGGWRHARPPHGPVRPLRRHSSARQVLHQRLHHAAQSHCGDLHTPLGEIIPEGPDPVHIPRLAGGLDQRRDGNGHVPFPSLRGCRASEDVGGW